MSFALRAAVAAALVLGGAVVAAPPSGAHACAQVRVHVSSGTTAVGSCHEPGATGHVCVRTDPDTTVSGTGVGATACAPS